MPRRVLSPQEVQEAVKCANWQRFRLSLKGELTERKLDRLALYLLDHHSCCGERRKDTQVLNYLHALARGGRIAPLAQDFTFWEAGVRTNWTDDVMIRH